MYPESERVVSVCSCEKTRGKLGTFQRGDFTQTRKVEEKDARRKDVPGGGHTKGSQR